MSNKVSVQVLLLHEGSLWAAYTLKPAFEIKAPTIPAVLSLLVTELRGRIRDYEVGSPYAFGGLGGPTWQRNLFYEGVPLAPVELAEIADTVDVEIRMV